MNILVLFKLIYNYSFITIYMFVAFQKQWFPKAIYVTMSLKGIYAKMSQNATYAKWYVC